jgi:hypothetical protein
VRYGREECGLELVRASQDLGAGALFGKEATLDHERRLVREGFEELSLMGIETRPILTTNDNKDAQRAAGGHDR